MRYAIVSDIHSNLEAFQAVLQDIEARGGVDRFWCLGDIVGYGPNPGECIELLRRHDHLCVAGNHDLCAIDKVDSRDFNSDAATACKWTGQQLTAQETDYVAALPTSICEGDFTLAHGSPRQPIWEYLISTYGARISFEYFDTRYCLVGHSHVPLVFALQESPDQCTCHEPPIDTPISLEGNRLIVNPGSVGQPRDSDPRASYAVYDSDSNVMWLHRVPYDISATQQKMMDCGLPARLASRLTHGR
jgi:diadenosine tetraphosphatase ApaH/serine/threonine PP2A family protein phosphatase